MKLKEQRGQALQFVGATSGMDKVSFSGASSSVEFWHNEILQNQLNPPKPREPGDNMVHEEDFNKLIRMMGNSAKN